MSNAIIVEPLAISSVKAIDGSATGYDPAVVANDLLGVVWQSEVETMTRLRIDLGSDVPFDTIILLGLGGTLSTATLQVSIATDAQGPSFGPSWSDSARTLTAGANAPRSGRQKSLWTAPAGAPAAARYIMLRFDIPASSAISVGRVIVGQRIALQRNFRFGAARGVRSLGDVRFSPSGVPLVRRGGKLRTIGLSFSAIYNDEVENSIAPLIERVGTDTPIALVTDPADHADRQNRIYFGYLDGAPGTVQARAASYQADFNMVALD